MRTFMVYYVDWETNINKLPCESKQLNASKLETLPKSVIPIMHYMILIKTSEYVGILLGIKCVFYYLRLILMYKKLICRRLNVRLVLLGLELAWSTTFWDLTINTLRFLVFENLNTTLFSLSHSACVCVRQYAGNFMGSIEKQ